MDPSKEDYQLLVALENDIPTNSGSKTFGGGLFLAAADQETQCAGETVTRIAHYALVTKNARRVVYRFYLTAGGKVADFDWERR